MVRDGIKKGGGYDFENAQCAGNANEEYDAEWSFVDNVYKLRAETPQAREGRE
jgi:hypothetical protein